MDKTEKMSLRLSRQDKTLLEQAFKTASGRGTDRLEFHGITSSDKASLGSFVVAAARAYVDLVMPSKLGVKTDLIVPHWTRPNLDE